MISDNLSFVVGDGQRIKFWKDRWCGDIPLNVVFPSLFTCACAKEAWVGDAWSVEQGRVCWNPTFIWSMYRDCCLGYGKIK